MKEHERLKHLRKTLGFTQVELSQALDIKQGSYSDVERGKAGISAMLMKVLLRKFNVNPLWLCEGAGSMFVEEKETVSQFRESANDYEMNSKAKVSVSTSDIDKYIDQAEKQQKHLENLNNLIDFLK